MSLLTLAITILALTSVDGPSYYTVQWNSETVFDTRTQSATSFWDYHTFTINGSSGLDTIKVVRGRCPVYPGSVETFMVVDDASKQIVKEYKFLGSPRLAITTEALFAGLEHLNELSIYHYAEVDGTEPRRIVKVMSAK